MQAQCKRTRVTRHGAPATSGKETDVKSTQITDCRQPAVQRRERRQDARPTPARLPRPVPRLGPPINPALLKRERERAEARQNRAADKITAFSGSMLFVYVHVIWFACWIGFGVEDYPYGLLTMIVSLEAIFLSTFVMISQNRADARRQVIADQQWRTVQEEDKQNVELLDLSRQILALTKAIHSQHEPAIRRYVAVAGSGLRSCRHTAQPALQSAEAPAADQGRWIKTIPDKGWFVYFRIYRPEAPAFDRSWQLPDFEITNSTDLADPGGSNTAPAGRAFPAMPGRSRHYAAFPQIAGFSSGNRFRHPPIGG